MGCPRTGILILASLLLCIAIMRLRPNGRRRGLLFEFKHFKDKAYTTFCIGKSSSGYPGLLIFEPIVVSELALSR